MRPELKPDIQLIEKHLRAISCLRDPFENPEMLAEVQQYIAKELVSYGYTTETHAFEFEKRTFENVIGYRAPRPDKPRLIIGAHFDAVPGSPGADDNASGVAGMLEIARILAPFEISQHIDFIGFNMEEYGMIGSRHYAPYLKKGDAKLLGMVSLEMIGFTSSQKGSQKLPLPLKPFYPNTGNFVALVGDLKSQEFLKQAKTAFKEVPGLPVETLVVPANGWIFFDVRLSDQSAFWDAGYPALLITDTSFFRNPYYHTPSDKISTLNFDFLAKIVEGVTYLAFNLIKP